MSLIIKQCKNNFLKYFYKVLYQIPFMLNKNSFHEKYNHYKHKLLTIPHDELASIFQERSKCDLQEIDKIAEKLDFGVISNEIWYWNEFYGNAQTYKKYAGYPDNYQLKFVIDHAVYFYANFLHPEEYLPNLPAHMVTSNFAKTFLQQKVDKKLYPVSMHILYVEDYYSEEKFKLEKQKLGKNLLVFPVHSVHGLFMDSDVKLFIAEILKVKKEYMFDSVTICMYFCDVERGLHKKFDGYGFKIVTAGHALDKNFLARLKTIIKLSDITMSNSVGSHIFYSIGLNKPHYLWEDKTINITNPYLSGNEQEKERETCKNIFFDNDAVISYYKIFGEFSDKLNQEQLEVRDKICDLKEFKTPEQIREIFEETEEMYKRGNYMKYNKDNPAVHIYKLQEK